MYLEYYFGMDDEGWEYEPDVNELEDFINSLTNDEFIETLQEVAVKNKEIRDYMEKEFNITNIDDYVNISDEDIKDTLRYEVSDEILDNIYDVDVNKLKDFFEENAYQTYLDNQADEEERENNYGAIVH